MNFKWTLPYVFGGASLFAAVPASVSAQTNNGGGYYKAGVERLNKDKSEMLAKASSVHVSMNSDIQFTELWLEDKADELCDVYIGNMLRSQAKLKPLMGKRGYGSAVRSELPGAPVGAHCVYGQYTHLSNALEEQGDTIKIIPYGAHAACVSFKRLMQQKYGGNEYPYCICSGVMYASDHLYNVALEKYLLQNNVGENTPDSIRKKYIEKFASRNFSADGLDAGAILIVPRYRGSKNKFHAIMYLGRGCVRNGKFVADPNGGHVYTGHNRENMGDLFNAFDTSNVFAADIRKIARIEYGKELERIESMTHSELVEFLSNGTYSKEQLRKCSHEVLLRMARDKYFKRVAPIQPVQSAPEIAYNPFDHIFNLKLDQRTL